jgi:hypothetical protein
MPTKEDDKTTKKEGETTAADSKDVKKPADKKITDEKG